MTRFADCAIRIMSAKIFSFRPMAGSIPFRCRIQNTFFRKSYAIL
jgi:hypothetical protein